MNARHIVIDFLSTSALVLTVSLIVTFLYSLVVHSSGVIDWETSVRFAVILGIVLPWIHRSDRRQVRR